MTKEEIRAGVIESLPLLQEIEDVEIRNKVVEAWTLSLSHNGYKRIEDIEGSGSKGGYCIGNQAQHILCVTRLAVSLASIIADTYSKDLKVSSDYLIAAGLIHDVGKPYEYNRKKCDKWESDPAQYGYPNLRHTIYGAYIALTVGLPEELVHVCGCHSPEGELVQRNIYATIIHHADKASWRIPGCADGYRFPHP